jgi:phosphoserine phosphatase
MALRLAIFDLDGTLKQVRDPYVFLHKRLGTWEAAQVFSAKGMAGELSYDDWLRLDASLWKGVSRATMEEFFREDPYLPGARQTVLGLRKAGVRVALVSSGPSVHAEQVQAELGLDQVFANQILFENGRATGQACTRVPENGKARIVAQLQHEMGVEPGECLAVGDSPSDIDMFRQVHLGVAVNPSSEEVREAAGLLLEGLDLRPLIPRMRDVMPGWMRT